MKMKEEEARELIGKKVKIILGNGYNYTGDVLSTAEDTLTLKDKFENSVSMCLNNIIVCEIIKNGEGNG